MIFFNCGKEGHISSLCRSESKPPRRFFTCGGIGHIDRNCPSPKSLQSFPNPSPNPSPNSKFSGVVESAGTGAFLLFTEVTIDGIRVRELLIDTGSPVSMVRSSLYPLLVSRPPIQSFEKSAPDIVGVGGSRAEYSGLIDVPLEIAGVEVAQPLHVVSNMPFPILSGTDTLRRHDSTVILEDECPLQLHTRVCEIRLEQRNELNFDPRREFSAMCAIDKITKDTEVRDRARSLNAAPPSDDHLPM